MTQKREVEISHQQVLQPDGSVFSMQSLELPPRLGATLSTEGMLDSYLVHVRRVTFSLVRPVTDAGGIRFTLLGSPIALLRFLPPRQISAPGREELLLQIAGGALVQRQESHSGSFSFIVSRDDDRICVTLQLAGFCPMLLGSRHPSPLRKMLYSFSQARIHTFTGVEFLGRLYREVTGIRPVVRKTQVWLREGTGI